ncbi:hypothetical protein RchiOBHm_Chr7g0219811 [Rosa chinensis]|uniref:Uncharacterized protein n=1 Tax=Rosa chinensis TaxID=74649 RepID=A0A2P6PCL6_ROSCH|nr:hypothetical protein RchiOBHm_Chr7g0219811 [Rosa chinensis]
MISRMSLLKLILNRCFWLSRISLRRSFGKSTLFSWTLEDFRVCFIVVNGIWLRDLQTQLRIGLLVKLKEGWILVIGYCTLHPLCVEIEGFLQS